MRPSLRGSSSLFFVAQLITSATNFVLTFAMSRALAPEAFGKAALGLGIALFVVALQRTVVGDNLLVFIVDRQGVLPGAQASIAFAVLAATGLSLVAVVAFPSIVPWYVAAALPLLLLQDGMRYVAVAIKRAGRVVLSDAIWLLAAIGALAVSVTGGDIGRTMTIWLLGGALAVAVLWPVSRPEAAELRWQRVREFARTTRDVSGWAGAQFLLGNGGVQVAYIGMAIAAGAAAYGGYRVAQLMLAPFLTVILGSISPFVAWVGRHPEMRWDVGRFSAATAAYMIAAAVPALAVVRWGPEVIERVSGAGYVPYAPLLVPAGTALVLVAAAVPPGVLLRGHGRGRALFVSGIIGTLPAAVVVPVAAAVWGISAAAWAMALVYLVTWVAGVVYVRPLLARAPAHPG